MTVTLSGKNKTCVTFWCDKPEDSVRFCPIEISRYFALGTSDSKVKIIKKKKQNLFPIFRKIQIANDTNSTARKIWKTETLYLFRSFLFFYLRRFRHSAFYNIVRLDSAKTNFMFTVLPVPYSNKLRPLEWYTATIGRKKKIRPIIRLNPLFFLISYTRSYLQTQKDVTPSSLLSR